MAGRKVRVCLDWCRAEGLGRCDELCKSVSPEILESLVRLVDEEGREALERLDAALADLLASLGSAGPEVRAHMREVLEQLGELVGEPEFPWAVAAVLGDPELEELVGRLSAYEVFLEEVARRVRAAAAALESFEEQSREGR